jgi:type III secretory pathway component EscV
LVREVVPTLVTPVVLSEVLQCLAKEGISLRHLADVLTALAKQGVKPGDPGEAVERARAALKRQITFQYGSPDGSVDVYFVDAMIEDALRDAIRTTEAGAHLALPPALARDIVAAVERAVTGVRRPAILASADIRRHLRALLEHEQPEVAVLSHQELLPETTLHTLGYIDLQHTSAYSEG